MSMASFLLPVLVLLPVLGGLVCWFSGTAGEKRGDARLLRLRDGTGWLVPTAILLLVVFLLINGFEDEIRWPSWALPRPSASTFPASAAWAWASPWTACAGSSA